MSRYTRSSNPTLRPEIFERYQATAGGNAMTVSGAINKTFFLLVMAFFAASFTWRSTFSNPGMAQSLMMLGIIGGFITALITCFSVTSARFTAPIYAVFEGLFLGSVSAVISLYHPLGTTLVTQALLITFLIAGCMLFLYRTGIVKVTEKFRAGIIAATFGLVFAYLFSFILSMFGLITPISSTGVIGIVFSLVVVVIASLNLVLDFDVIVKGAQSGAPEYFEWYAAFGLLVTLVWLYIEVLNLLIKLQGGNRD
ncbi:MAG: Bax inhibitor-1/YccA family protein [Candidatus Rifleibacteriota bacterium]